MSGPLKLSTLDLLWPYGPGSGRKIDQMEVVAELADGTRWVSSFFDTHRYNQGVKSFQGMGSDRPFRFGPRLVIVKELTESAIRETVDALIEDGHFEEAFEKIADAASPE